MGLIDKHCPVSLTAALSAAREFLGAMGGGLGLVVVWVEWQHVLRAGMSEWAGSGAGCRGELQVTLLLRDDLLHLMVLNAVSRPQKTIQVPGDEQG